MSNELDRIVDSWIIESGVTSSDRDRKGKIPSTLEKSESTIKSGLGFKKSIEVGKSKKSSISQGKEQLFGSSAKNQNSRKTSRFFFNIEVVQRVVTVCKRKRENYNPESHNTHGLIDNLGNEESRTSIGASKAM